MGFHWLSRPLIRSIFGVVGNFLCVFSCLIIISNVWKTQTHILRWSSWGWMLTEFRTIWFKNASRNLVRIRSQNHVLKFYSFLVVWRMELASETFRIVSCQPTRKDYEKFFSIKLDLGVRIHFDYHQCLDRTCHFDIQNSSTLETDSEDRSKYMSESEKNKKKHENHENQFLSWLLVVPSLVECFLSIFTLLATFLATALPLIRIFERNTKMETPEVGLPMARLRGPES